MKRIGLNAAAKWSLASSDATNEPDPSGVRVGPEQIQYSAEGGTRTLTPEGTGT